MELELWRYNGGTIATLGLLMENRTTNRELLCFTCEDEFRAKKIRGETRIPPGSYRIKLRNEGGMTKRYRTNFPHMHRGMLHLQDVPGFEWVYIHIGNDEDDTEGCILVGEDRNEKGRTIQRSRSAYRQLYAKILGAMDAGEEIWITIVDLDRPILPRPEAPPNQVTRGPV